MNVGVLILHRFLDALSMFIIYISDMQSVTKLITRRHSALSVVNNVALLHIVQENMRKTDRF